MNIRQDQLGQLAEQLIAGGRNSLSRQVCEVEECRIWSEKPREKRGNSRTHSILRGQQKVLCILARGDLKN
ncbi:hypothetical protein AAHA92_07778 [Salvia divinorum]|uniref:Uncharacterized protein n=1 Tax=Salvia divinorum TaxID=28513 RepID=A0ABD1IB12_SALDI